MNIKFLNCENFLQGINALQEDMSFKISNEADYSISFAESDEDILKVSVSGSDAEISCNQKARFGLLTLIHFYIQFKLLVII